MVTGVWTRNSFKRLEQSIKCQFIFALLILNMIFFNLHSPPTMHMVFLLVNPIVECMAYGYSNKPQKIINLSHYAAPLNLHNVLIRQS